MADGQVVIQVKSNAKDAARDFDRLDKSLDNTEKELKQVDRAADKADGSIVSLKGAATALVGALAIREIADFSKGLINVASDAEETANKFNVVFSSIQSDAQEAADTLAESFGLAGDEAQKFLSDTGDLLTGFGFTQEAALDLSVQLNSLAVDLASFTNVEGGTERATQALTSALFGETEAAKSLGIVITQDVVKAKVEALRATGELTDETDNEARAIATLQLAYEQSKNAIGDFARSQESFANQSRIATANIRDLKVELGERLLPVATDGIEIFNTFAEALNKALGKQSELEIAQENFRETTTRVNDLKIALEDARSTFENSFSGRFIDFEDTGISKQLNEQLTTALQARTEAQAAFNRERALAREQETQQQQVSIENANAQIEKQNELTNAIKDSSSATQEFQEKAVESFDFAGSAADNFSRNATRSLLEPWEDGETAADKFKEVALNTIADILAEFIAAELKKQAVALVTAALTGGSSLASGLFSGSVDANAKGGAFDGVKKYAKGGIVGSGGGVVSSPTFFNAGGKLSVAGEAGAEVIAPAKRMRNGDMGVQVEQSPVNVNVINNAPVQVQSVVRPDNQLDVIIDQFNVAASNSRTSAGFTEAFSRNSLAGTYGV